MLRNKHLRLDQNKIDRVRRILKANTETEGSAWGPRYPY
jgi:hypothetical protein